MPSFPLKYHHNGLTKLLEIYFLIQDTIFWYLISVWKMKHLGSTGMLWTVPVCSGQYRFVFRTSMLWEVPVLFRPYLSQKETGTAQIVPVLPGLQKTREHVPRQH